MKAAAYENRRVEGKFYPGPRRHSVNYRISNLLFFFKISLKKKKSLNKSTCLCLLHPLQGEMPYFKKLGYGRSLGLVRRKDAGLVNPLFH